MPAGSSLNSDGRAGQRLSPGPVSAKVGATPATPPRLTYIPQGKYSFPISPMHLAPTPSYPQHYTSWPMSMHNHDHGIPQPNMPPPRSPQIDPALSMYSSYYPYQHQHQHQQPISHHLPLPNSLSSPSSQGSDTIGTPPTENMSFSPPDVTGKRPPSLVSGTGDPTRKKPRTDDFTDGPATEKDESKPKSTRGAR